MVHEFEEIICIKNWIHRHAHNEKLYDEMFIKGKKNYPSTPTISIMIGEEFVILSTLLFVAIRFQMMELALALVLVYTMHLVVHIYQACKYKAWPPGSRTATYMLLPILYIIYSVFYASRVNIKSLLFMTILVAVIMVLNLWLLHRSAQKVERWRKTNL